MLEREKGMAKERATKELDGSFVVKERHTHPQTRTRTRTHTHTEKKERQNAKKKENIFSKREDNFCILLLNKRSKKRLKIDSKRGRNGVGEG